MNEWSHLPNAKHIDWVLESVGRYTNEWGTVLRQGRPESWYATWGIARFVAHHTIHSMRRKRVWDAAYHAIWNSVTWAELEPGRLTASDVILALVAYDDCAHLLDMTSDRLKMWAVLSEQPAAVLLLPAVIARERIRELDMS
jgi:hypothetical protein